MVPSFYVSNLSTWNRRRNALHYFIVDLGGQKNTKPGPFQKVTFRKVTNLSVVVFQFWRQGNPQALPVSKVTFRKVTNLSVVVFQLPQICMFQSCEQGVTLFIFQWGFGRAVNYWSPALFKSYFSKSHEPLGGCFSEVPNLHVSNMSIMDYTTWRNALHFCIVDLKERDILKPGPFHKLLFEKSRTYPRLLFSRCQLSHSKLVKHGLNITVRSALPCLLWIWEGNTILKPGRFQKLLFEKSRTSRWSFLSRTHLASN